MCVIQPFAQASATDAAKAASNIATRAVKEQSIHAAAQQALDAARAAAAQFEAAMVEAIVAESDCYKSQLEPGEVPDIVMIPPQARSAMLELVERWARLAATAANNSSSSKPP